MKKLITLIAVCFLFTAYGFANPYSSFNTVLNRLSEDEAEHSLNIFAEDFGQAISGGSYGLGAYLGKLGIYASVKMSYQQTSDNDIIVKDSGSNAIYFPILQLMVGLPCDFNALVRFSNYEGSILIGGGLTYALLKGRDFIIPSITLQSVYTYANTDSENNKFDISNLKNSITAAFDKFLLVKPYVFLSYDITHLKANSSIHSGISSDVKGTGYGAGLNVSLGIINIAGAVSIYERQPNYSLGLYIGF
jgi:hypothetical protein